MDPVRRVTLPSEVGAFTPKERATQAVAWAYRWYKVALRTVKQWSNWETIPLEQAFGEVQKLHRRAPQEVPVPELRGVPVMAEAAHLVRGGVYTIPEDYVTVLNDVLYCPRTNLLLSDERKIIEESLSTGLISTEPMREAEVEPRSGCFTLLRSLHNAHYHVLVDNMPRLMALDRPPFSEGEAINVLCPGGPTSVEKYLFSKLAPANARIDTPAEDRLYRLEKVLFTPFKHPRYAGYMPAEYLERFREKILPNRPSARDRRFYISREDLRRHVANREELMAALEARGFEKLIAETLSPEEEVQTFYDAEAIIGVHGSGLANMIFSKHLKVVELSPFWYLSPHYFYLSKSLGHDYGLWRGTDSRWFAPSFTVDVSGVLRLLDRMGIR